MANKLCDIGCDAEGEVEGLSTAMAIQFSLIGLGYFFSAPGFFATRVAGKYPVRVRTVSLPIPCASAVT